MPKVIYALGGVSADGYSVGTRALAGHPLGRRLYKTMVYWETADKDPSDIVREFALICASASNRQRRSS